MANESNGNGKIKPATVVGIVTSIITVIILTFTVFINISSHSDKISRQRSDTIGKLQSRVSVLENTISNCKKTDHKLSQEINELKAANSKLDKQLGIMTEILNRLDRRTKRLEQYFYSSQRDKEESNESG